jgi:hypothetical protein
MEFAPDPSATEPCFANASFLLCRYRFGSQLLVSELLSLFALSTTSIDTSSAPAALSRCVEALCATSNDVLVFGYNEFYRMMLFVNRYTQAPVRFAIELSESHDRCAEVSRKRSFHGINVSTGTIDSAHPTFSRAKIARC